MPNTLTHVVVANRLTGKNNLGIKMHGTTTPIFIKCGEDNHDVTGDVESFIYGNMIYKLDETKTSLTGGHGALVIVVEVDEILRVSLADGSELESLDLKGERQLGAIPQPDTALLGTPDSDLAVEALAGRYFDRAVSISENNFGRGGNRLFFAADGDDKFDALVASLSAQDPDPAKEAANGTVPATTHLQVSPDAPQVAPGTTSEDLALLMSRIAKGRAAVSLYSNLYSIAMRTKRGHADPYKVSIPEEASQLNEDLADSTVSCLAGPLSGYFSSTDNSQNTIDKEMFTTEIHLEFLNSVFDGFGFSKPQRAQLDSILTNVASTLSSLKISSASSSSSLNHTMFNGGLKSIIMVDDNGKDQVLGTEATLRLTYLHVEQNSWSVSIGKSSAEKVHFQMSYSDNTFTINNEVFDKFVPKLDKVIDTLVSKNAEDFGNFLISAKVDGQIPDASAKDS